MDWGWDKKSKIKYKKISLRKMEYKWRYKVVWIKILYKKWGGK